MIHHERLRPPSHDYPADEWNVIEKGFHPEFLAQLETMLALGNGYLGMRGCPEEGGPSAENSTLINGFYETRPIVYPEDAFGFAKTGQTIFSVTDSKIIKLFVDDEPFWLPNANLLSYDRRLNMKSGTLDREILWETPAGKQVLITSRRLVSFANRHVAAISYQVTLLNAAASLVISSEMAAHEPVAQINSAGSATDESSLQSGCSIPEPAMLKTAGSCCAMRLKRAVDPGVCDRPFIGDLVPARPQGCSHRGFRPSRLHNRSSAGLSDPPHQIHGLSHVADGFG